MIFAWRRELSRPRQDEDRSLAAMGGRALGRGSLARHRLAVAYPLVREVNAVHLAVDAPIQALILGSKRAILLKHLRTVAGNIDKDRAGDAGHLDQKFGYWQWYPFKKGHLLRPG